MNLTAYNKKIANNSLPLYVDFWAPWCGPCKAMDPILTEVSKRYSGKIELLKINVDESPDIAKALGIMGIPTSMGYAGGKQVFRKTGFQPKAGIERIFKDLSDGKPTVSSSISTFNRILRLVLGTALIIFGAYRGPSILLILAGALVAFTAVYDRCPIYRAVSEKIKELFLKRIGVQIELLFL